MMEHELLQHDVNADSPRNEGRVAMCRHVAINLGSIVLHVVN